MKFFNYHHLDILEYEPDFQIDEVLEISERLTYYKDDFREVWLDGNQKIVKEKRFENGNIFYFFESNKIENETEDYTITLYDEKGKVTNCETYKRPKSLFFLNSIFYEQTFHHFSLEEKGQLCFYKYFWKGQLPDGWLKTPFIKKENDFEEIIITDKKQNVKAQILKINDCVYSERRFSHSFDCDFYFLGVKKRKAFKNFDEEGKLLLQEFDDEKGFNSQLFQYRFLTDGYTEANKKCFLNDKLVEEKKITICIKTT